MKNGVGLRTKQKIGLLAFFRVRRSTRRPTKLLRANKRLNFLLMNGRIYKKILQGGNMHKPVSISIIGLLAIALGSGILSAQLILEDDFERYTVGQFPSAGGWFERYNGAGQNRIVNDFVRSGEKSFYIQGRPRWSACIENHRTQVLGAPVMSYEAYIYLRNRADAVFSFYDWQPQWGWSAGTVFFSTDGNIYATGTGGAGRLLRSYSTGTWYRINVVADSVSARYAVWIDGVSYGDTYRIVYSAAHRWSDCYFTIGQGHDGNDIRVDDVKVWRGRPSIYLPDLHIANNPDFSDGVGDNVYNTTGAGQIKNQSVPRNTTANYYIRSENDADSADVILIRDTTTLGSGWSVAYFDTVVGGSNITNQVRGAGYPVSLPPRGRKAIRMEVTPQTAVPGNTTQAVLLLAKSERDTSQMDAVKSITTALYSHDVGTIAILAPTGFLAPNVQVTPKARVRNFGASSEAFPVKFKIGTVYSDSVTISNLPPLRDTVVSFRPWTTAIGTYTTSCSTMLARDENPANDKATGTVRVETLPARRVGRYAIVVSSATYNNHPDWRAVVDTLYYKYRWDAQIFTWNASVTEVRDTLASYQPDFIAFVCRPAVEATETFIRTVHQMTRQLDADPYGDAVWSIITGYEAANAMRAIKSELVVKTTVGAITTANPSPPTPPYRPFYQAIGTFETQGGPRVLYSFSDGTVLDTMDPGHIHTDRTRTFANWLNQETLNIVIPGRPEFRGNFDMFVTSGHANVNEWQAHFPHPGPEGFFRSSGGQLRADHHGGGSTLINSRNPKVWLCPGNCLIGNPNNINNMVYAWMNSGGGIGFYGYMVVTWYGYQGWGTLCRFVMFPGVYTLAQAFYGTNQCLIFDRANNTPGTNPSGLDWDRDAVAIYGDPASIIMYSPPDTCWGYYSQRLVHIPAERPAPDTFIFTIRANIDECRPGTHNQPFYFLPVRIDPATVHIETTDAHQAIITDNFVMLYCWYSGEPGFPRGTTRFVRWTARSLVGVAERPDYPPAYNRPELFLLSSNPVRGRIKMEYLLPYQANVKVSVQDIAGRVVKTLVSSEVRPGIHRIDWDGEGLSSGVYFITLRANEHVASKRILLVR